MTKRRSPPRALVTGTVLAVSGGTPSRASLTDGTDQIWVAAPAAGGRIASWSAVTAPSPLHYDGGSVVHAGRDHVVLEGGLHRSASLAFLDDWRTEPAPTFATPDGASVRAIDLCDAVLHVLADGLAMTVPADAGALGEWRIASRIHGRASSGFSAASIPGGRAYVLGGAHGRVPIERAPSVWSTARRRA